MPKIHNLLLILACVGGLAACSTPGPGEMVGEVHDPYEASNRANHTLNKGLDQTIVRPVSVAVSNAVPDEFETVLGNAVDNLGRPASAVNHLLQGDLLGVGRDVTRFALNSTLGILGLFDVAADFGIPEDDTDFGETLYVWGVGEGAYVELPVLGPSTERAMAGRIVDAVLDPVGAVANSGQAEWRTGMRVADRLSARGRFADALDSVLYDSADSYAQSRLLYLQNRRFELGDTAANSVDDPFMLDTEGF